MKIDSSTIEKYQLILERDPKSQVFAPLAEAYREMGLLKEAQKIVTVGVQRHPQLVSGLVTHAKVMRDLKNFEIARESLKKATSLSTDNILAHHLLAEVHLALKNPKEALKSFKMVLFLNPNSQSAQKAVQKLESLTADEYEPEVFEMTKLPEVTLNKVESISKENSSQKPANAEARDAQCTSKSLERILSLVDAFIVRNDLEKAQTLLIDTQKEFKGHPEVEKRLRSLQGRFGEPEESATPIAPLTPRKQQINDKKLEVLNMMLRKIEACRSQG
jgi:tetratricopeptide (TPR) repeat protein